MGDNLAITQNNYGKIERGEIDVNVSRLIQLAKVFEISLKILLFPDSEDERTLAEFEREIEILKREKEILEREKEIINREKSFAIETLLRFIEELSQELSKEQDIEQHIQKFLKKFKGINSK